MGYLLCERCLRMKCQRPHRRNRKRNVYVSAGHFLILSTTAPHYQSHRKKKFTSPTLVTSDDRENNKYNNDPSRQDGISKATFVNLTLINRIDSA